MAGRAIRTYPGVAWVRSALGRMGEKPGRIAWSQRLQAVSRAFFQKAMRDGLFDRASALAFQVIFSLIPLFALAYVVFAFSGGYAALVNQVEKFVIENFAPSVGDQVIAYMNDLRNRVSPGTIGVFAVLGFVWIGVAMVSKAEHALNAIWGVVGTRSLRKRAFVYSLTVVTAPLVVGVSLAITSYLAAQLERQHVFGDLAIVFLTLIPLAFSASFLAIVFWALPYTSISRRAAVTAGLVTAVVVELFKQAFTFYASWSLGRSIYGSLAALPILFLWIYLGSLVFLLGAELCYFLDSRTTGVVHVAAPESFLSFQLLIDILRLFQVQGERGGQPLTVKSVVGTLRWDLAEVSRHVHYLNRIGLLRAAKRYEARDGVFEAVAPDFETAIRRLVENINRVRYGRVDHVKYGRATLDANP